MNIAERVILNSEGHKNNDGTMVDRKNGLHPGSRVFARRQPFESPDSLRRRLMRSVLKRIALGVILFLPAGVVFGNCYGHSRSGLNPDCRLLPVVHGKTNLSQVGIPDAPMRDSRNSNIQ